MRHPRPSLRLAMSALAVLAFAASANAAPFISGYGWVTTEALSQNASPASLANLSCHGGSACTQANADVTFDASGIGFDSRLDGGADYTIANFLNSEGFASNIQMHNGVLATRSIDPMLWEFTGSAFFTNGQAFDVAHDDGLTMIVNGVHVLDAAGPTAPTTSHFVYNGPTGNFAFDFIYGECCGAPAVFETTLVPSSVPEPASLVLFGLGLAGVARKRRRNS